ncbi:MAG: CHAT domain-containing protein, partial [Saprospiraceae bacterium]|nr:CHAT domain-containing protein [Saprospiraceae bacterium]
MGIFLLIILAHINVAHAQISMPDTAIIGAKLGRLYQANRDSINVPAYRRTGITLSKMALDTATLYRRWMPARFFDAWEVRALYMFNYEGKRDAASEMFDSLLMWRNQYDSSSIKYALSVYHKSRVNYANGLYPKSDSLMQLALKIFKDKGDTMSVQYAKVYNAYGQLLINLGRAADAEKVMSKALRLIERAGSRRDYTYQLNDWGESITRLKKFGQAEQAFLDVRRILDSLYHADPSKALDPMYFGAGVNLSKLYFIQKNKFKLGEDLLKADLLINPDTFSTPYFGALTNLGGAYFERRRYADARVYYDRSLTIRKRMFPGTHKEVLNQEFLLAMLNYAEKRSTEAQETIITRIPFCLQSLSNASDYFSEREMLVFQNSYVNEYAIACSFAWDNPNGSMAGLIYDYVLTTKTAILDNTLRIRAAVQHGGPEAQKQWEQWVRLKKELDNAIQYNDPTSELEEEVSRLEKEMNSWKKDSEVFAREKVTWENVRDALKPGEVAVEFIRFPYRNPFTTDSFLYAALILRKGYTAPRLVKLFEQRQIRELLKNVNDSVANSYTILYRGNTGGLDKLIWTDKLDQYIERGETVYYSMDGDLLQINPAAIALGKTGESLFDFCGPLIDVSSTRELALRRQYGQNTSTYPNASDYALIYGGIEYGLPTDDLPVGTKISKVPYPFLPGTQQEAEFLDSLCKKLNIPSTLFLGPGAKESTIHAAGSNGHSPWLLHIGTHGFYFKRQQKPSADAPYFSGNSDPMRRGGIMMANAYSNWNLNPRSGGPQESENGIFFAAEAAQLDLSQTYLTVIDACFSGAGEAKGFEGQFGIRRGFRVAGSDYLILSLWEANDSASVYFMNDFYKRLFAAPPEEIHKAFREAVQKQRDVFREPYYWANFVLIGP